MRNIFNRTSLGLLLLLLICAACREQKSSTQLERAYAALKGSHITFPDDMQLTCEGKDTVISHYCDADFKLVIYRDSLSCNQCYVETFPDWEKLINEYDSCFNKKLDFVFILSPLSKNEEDLRLNILGMEFKHPIYFDRKGSPGEKTKAICCQLSCAGRSSDHIRKVLDVDQALLLPPAGVFHELTGIAGSVPGKSDQIAAVVHHVAVAL